MGALVPPIDGSCQRKSSWGTQLRLEPGGGGEVDEDEE
jgi:hypothetical protein